MADDNFTERTIGDWTAYQDDEGRIYYHNEKNDESSWDPPPGFEDDGGLDGNDVDNDGDDDGGGDGDDNAHDGARTPPLDDGARTPPLDDGAQTPPLDDGADNIGDDDGISQSPVHEGEIFNDDDDRITQSPPTYDDGITQSPPAYDEGITQSPPADDDGITQSPPADEDEAEAEVEAEAEAPAAEEEEEVADGTEIGNGWVAYKDDEARIYYYNADSGETQWDRPDVDDSAVPSTPRSPTDDVPSDMKGYDEASDQGGETTAADEKSSPRESSAESPKKEDQWADDDDKMDTTEPSAAAEEEPENTAAMAEEFLQQPDAVMEPNVMGHINNLVQELGPQVAGPKAMQSLMNGYRGDTAVCGLMGLWLAELKSMGGGGGAATGKKGDLGVSNGAMSASLGGNNGNNHFFQEGADVARDVVEEIVNRLAKERFTKDGGDVIIKLSKKESAFIDKMIKSERWRKLLIDLSATNKDSKLFMYCLQSISNAGHHRAIANRINQSEYFPVFNSMLQSELSIAAKIAVDGYTKEVLDTIDTTKGPMGSLIDDLRRTCTSTSYTYLYAVEAINELITKSNKVLSEGVNSQSESLKRAMRKWERLREELEDEMLKPLKTGTTFQRKRRVDVAVTMSDLFQRKRRRMDPRLGDANNDVNGDSLGNASNSDLADTLDSALTQLLTKNSLGIQIDKEVADNMLKYAYGGSTDRIGYLLVKHPSAITSLLDNLYGSKRVRQLDTRLKCARLVALAVMASERLAQSENGQADTAQSDEDVLSQVILKGSQLCEQLENMVSFTVLDNAESTDNNSVGRQLCAMCIKHSVVSQGVLIWAKEFANGTDFVTTVSYPTISPCILSLARLICRHHPLTRPAILELSLIFMGHSNREISHQKMQSIKEQCLRLMLWLSTGGLSLAVISAVQNKLETGGSSEMDSALVRNFFSGMLEIVRPPVSLAFVRALGGLMMKRPCIDALLSKLLDASKREQIVQLIHHFEAAGDAQQVVWEEDKSLLSMLKSTYCSSSN